VKSQFSPKKFRALLFMGVILALLLGGFSFAQDGGRKVRNRVSPVYPEIARRVNAAGVVKLEVQIAPSGDVKSIKALGGHPLLIPAAEDAMKKWKYEPASDTTTAVVEFRFMPGGAS
jgi:TonB family protein